MKGTINLDGLAASFLGGWTGAGDRRAYRLSVVLTLPRDGEEPVITRSVHEGSGPRQAWVMASLWMQLQLRSAHALESAGHAVGGIAAAAQQAIGQLTPREREVLRERFGGIDE